MLDKLQTHLSNCKDKILHYLQSKNPLAPSLDVAKDVIELLPVKIMKIAMLNQEDSFAD